MSHPLRSLASMVASLRTRNVAAAHANIGKPIAIAADDYIGHTLANRLSSRLTGSISWRLRSQAVWFALYSHPHDARERPGRSVRPARAGAGRLSHNQPPGHS